MIYKLEYAFCIYSYIIVVTIIHYYDNEVYMRFGDINIYLMNIGVICRWRLRSVRLRMVGREDGC